MLFMLACESVFMVIDIDLGVLCNAIWIANNSVVVDDGFWSRLFGVIMKWIGCSSVVVMMQAPADSSWCVVDWGKSDPSVHATISL